MPLMRLLRGPTVGTRRNLQRRRSHARHYACVHAVLCGLKLADPDITTEPRGSQLRNPGRLIFSPPLLSPDAVRPWTCVASSIAAASRGDAAQAAFDHKLLHYRNEIGELRDHHG